MDEKYLYEPVVEDVRARLSHVQETITDPMQQSVVAGLASEVSAVLEGLQIIGEELRAQNDELAAASLLVERERLRYHELFDLAPDGYLVTDVHGVIQEANLKALDMFGVPSVNLFKKPLAVFISREHHPAYCACLARLQAGLQSDTIELDVRPRAGPKLTASVTVRNRTTEDGRIWWLLRDVTLHKKQEAELRSSEAQVAVLKAIVDERERLRRDLHDGVAQVLAYVRLRLNSVDAWLKQGEIVKAQQGVKELEEAAREANDDMRHALAGLRVSSILDLGLIGSLHEYVASFRAQSGVETNIIVDPGAQSHFPGAMEVQLQSIIHEALSNVRKHAKAQHATIHFQLVDSRTDIVVSDDGCGFDVAQSAATSFGLGILRDRAKILGADVHIESQPGVGTRVVIAMPGSDESAP